MKLFDRLEELLAEARCIREEQNRAAVRQKKTLDKLDELKEMVSTLGDAPMGDAIQDGLKSIFTFQAKAGSEEKK